MTTPTRCVGPPTPTFTATSASVLARKASSPSYWRSMLTQLSSRFRKLPIIGQIAAIVLPVLVVAALVASLVGPYTPSLGSGKSDKALSGPLSAKGSKLVDAHG